MTFRLRHLLGALALHAVLLGVLAGGVQCSRKHERPPVIRAVLLDPDRQKTAELKKQEQRRLQERRKAAEEKKKRDEAARRKQEEEKQRKAAEAAKRKEAERLKAEEAKRQKELAEKKKAEEEARRKKVQEEQREREEQARRELQEKARMEEALRQEATRREIEREQAARAATEAQKERALWIDAVTRHVTKKWHPPPSAPAAFACMVRVQQLPDGTVISARITQSCGNPLLDQSVEEAVLRASPLPTVSNPSLYLREFLFEFVP